MPSNPSFQCHERPPRFRQSVIPPPASHVPVPVVAQLRTGATPPTVPLLAHLGFESFQALRRYADPLSGGPGENPETCVPRPSLSRSAPSAPRFTPVVDASRIRARFLRRSPVPSPAPFFGSSALLRRRYAASTLLRPLLTSPPLSWRRSPQVRCRISSLVPPGST